MVSDGGALGKEELATRAFVGHSYDRARVRVYHSLLLLGPHSGQWRRLITIAVWKFMFRKLRSIATLMLCAVSASAAAMDRGQFKDVPTEIREWFENMRSPKGI